MPAWHVSPPWVNSLPKVGLPSPPFHEFLMCSCCPNAYCLLDLWWTRIYSYPPYHFSHDLILPISTTRSFPILPTRSFSLTPRAHSLHILKAPLLPSFFQKLPPLRSCLSISLLPLWRLLSSPQASILPAESFPPSLSQHEERELFALCRPAGVDEIDESPKQDYLVKVAIWV